MKTQNYIVRETQFTHGFHYLNEVVTDGSIQAGEHLIVSNGDKKITVTVGSKQPGANEIGLYEFQRRQLNTEPGNTVEIKKADGLAVGDRVEIGVTRLPGHWAETVYNADWIKSRLLNLPVAPKEIKKYIVGANRGIKTVAVSILETPSNQEVIIGKKTSVQIRFLDPAPGDEKHRIELRKDGDRTSAARPLGNVFLRPAVEHELFKTVLLPLLNRTEWSRIGLAQSKGIILYGPPGCGKTQVGRELKKVLQPEQVVEIRGPEIIDKFWGESERKLRGKFEEAASKSPSVLFIDELDAFGGKRNDKTCSFEQALVTQLLALMDGLDEKSGVIVIATTNRIETIDTALRRPGRFGKEIYIGPPDQDARFAILRHHTTRMKLLPDVDLGRLAERTYGFTGADLLALCEEAHGKAVDRALSVGKIRVDSFDGGIEGPLPTAPAVSRSDFQKALASIVPSPLRQYRLGMEPVGMDDIGGHAPVKQLLQDHVVRPWIHRKHALQTGVTCPRGIIFYGPAGNGKTMLAKATAEAMQWNVLATAGPEMMGKYAGEGEEKIRHIFATARDLAPALIIIDEIDACAAAREGHSHAGRSVVNQLLYEMQGLREETDILVIGTTNALELLDPALLRPGRFDYKMMVPPPDSGARVQIFETKLRRMNRSSDENWEMVLPELAETSQGLTGAEIAFVCQEAGRIALKEIDFGSPAVITARHVREAIHLFVKNRPISVPDPYRMTF